MAANNIKTFLNMKNKSWLSIGKIIIKCRKMLHDYDVIYSFFIISCTT